MTPETAPLAHRPLVYGVHIVRRLGEGGMGTVYLASDDLSRRTVALKVMSPQRARDPIARARFTREIESLSEVRHVNVVRLIRACVFGDTPFAMFERVHGHTMSRLGRQPWQVMVRLAHQLALATAAVHAAGWMHRDIKRSNVLVGDHGLVTLLDFGLARRIDDHEPSHVGALPVEPDVTTEGMVVGTPRYLAPESRRGERPTTAVDVYGLGLVMHEMLGGTLDAHGHVEPIAAERLPPQLGRILAGTLARSPRARPSAAVVAAALEPLTALN